MNSDFNAEVLSFRDIAPEAWDDVAPVAVRSPMVLYDWARCAAEAYGEGDLRVVVVGPRSAPAALLPLVVGPGPLRRHRFSGNDDGGLSIPCRDDRALPALAQAVVALGMPVDLGYYPADAPVIDEIRRAGRGRALVAARPTDAPAAPWLDLDPSWVEPDRHIKKKLAQSLRRRDRRLRELGDLAVEFHEPGEDEADALLDAVVRVEAQSWKDRAGTALTHDARQLAFLRRYARSVARHGRLHISLLRHDGRAVAATLGEIYNNAYWAHKIGYDESFGKFGPGILLQYQLIRHLAGRGVGRIDFQGQLNDFKRNWTDKALPTVALRTYPYNPRGFGAIGSDALRQVRKRLAAKRSELSARRAARPAAGG